MTRRRGSNAIEFALMLPILVVLLAGLADFGWWVNQDLLLTDVVRDAARAGAAAGSNAAVSVATSRVASGCLANQIPGACTAVVSLSAIPAGPTPYVPPGAALPPQQWLTVSVTAPYNSIVGLAPGVPVELSARIVMRVEK